MDLLDESHSQDALDFPVVYASAKAGRASLEMPENGGLPDSPDLEPLFKTILETIPAPVYTEGAPLQAHVTNLDASPVPRPARAGPRARGRAAEEPDRRVDEDRRQQAEREDHRAAGHRGARAQARRGGGPGRHRRDRRHPRHHDRRDPGRRREPRRAAADHGRRAGDLDDDRHQHLAARRPRPDQEHQGHRPPGQGPARQGAGRQRLAQDPRHRASGRLGGPGPWRAGAGDPGRADAARGLRAHRRQAAGGHPRGQRQGARAGRAPDHRRARRSTSARSPSCWRSARAGWSR